MIETRVVWNIAILFHNMHGWCLYMTEGFKMGPSDSHLEFTTRGSMSLYVSKTKQDL